jgi:hypothetical protein
MMSGITVVSVQAFLRISLVIARGQVMTHYGLMHGPLTIMDYQSLGQRMPKLTTRAQNRS